jgi:hypothetical protein
MRRIDAILVNKPMINTIPPMTSSKPIGRANEAGNPTILEKKCSVPAIFDSLGKPCAINATPARIRKGKGPYCANLSKTKDISPLLYRNPHHKINSFKRDH